MTSRVPIAANDVVTPSIHLVSPDQLSTCPIRRFFGGFRLKLELLLEPSTRSAPASSLATPTSEVFRCRRIRHVYSEIASNKRRSVIFIVAVLRDLAGHRSRPVGSSSKPLYHPRSTTAIASATSTNYGWTAGHRRHGDLRRPGLRRDPLLPDRGGELVLRVSGAVPADPAQYQQLHNLVEALAIGEGIPKPAVYVIDDPSPNAFATGVSPDKAAITFTTGLLAIMNREELEGVTGHEMSHIKNHDIRLLLVVGTMIGMAALLASILWRSAFFAGGGGAAGATSS